MRRPLLLAIVVILLPAGVAEAAACKRVNGRIGYYAKDIRTGDGASCRPVRTQLKRWLDGPITRRIAGPTGWSCTRRSSKKRIAYSCDPGRGRVRFVLRFSAS